MMFEQGPLPRVFAQEPGADFPASVARGLRLRLQGQPPEAMARVEVLVNTARMRSRVIAAMVDAGAGFLPRVRLITDLAEGFDSEAPVHSPLRRRLELAQLIRKLLETEPDLAPRHAAFSLSESLSRLLDEMHAEGVLTEALETLDVSNHSEHWARSLRFIRLVAGYLGADSAPDTQTRQRQAVEALIARWADAPPTHPLIIAGSTGSRGTTALLMQAVARLPQGALILPGFDFDMPETVWAGLEDPLLSEDHPQYRYFALLQALGLTARDVPLWAGPAAPDSARNRLVSLALRPAPVTDRWLSEGQGLGDLIAATKGITLIEAPNPRAEALAIALRLRQAVLDGQKAALITPDRSLSRQVIAALDRWHLRPDDSAGRPLALSAPGRFLRQTAEAMRGELGSEALVALLKHPIAHSATARGQHLLHLRELELWLRRRAIPFPQAEDLHRWAGQNEGRLAWAAWLGGALVAAAAERPLEDWLTAHLRLSETLAGGAGAEGSGELWLAEAGQAARAAMDELCANAEHGGTLTIMDYIALLETLFLGKEVREAVESHPDLMIWGTLEARALGADLVVLAGLNDGIWPQSPQPDPWFNRRMRLDAGLLLPERQIGLSAHDFQQAIGAQAVVLTRATRDAEAETIPSRWLNRLKNLISGLPLQNGPEALAQMTARGADWLALAAAFEADLGPVPPVVAARNPRPAPAPPVSARMRELPVTAIKALIRDPYHIYASTILRLRSLDPLAPEPDARLRGTALHLVFEEYTKSLPPGETGSAEALMAIAETVLAQEVPWSATRIQWLARLSGVAQAFVDWQASQPGTPVLTESKGALNLSDPLFRLTGRPDRIDRQPDGRLRIFDYKTGNPPSQKEQEHFDKQLILLAMMAEEGAFNDLDPATVELAEFIGVGTKFKCEAADVGAEALREHRARLHKLLSAYLSPDQGFTARRALKKDTDSGQYDQLARLGEWQVTDTAETIPVGDRDE
ncbi:double-strand break repair protein AddB [Pararhodobacter sp.]|uniref:double-strand break repair protein AddB n=1 Tax=Pararhodobacter sp. TaxID=2127056 RepID=UPI002FDDC56C